MSRLIVKDNALINASYGLSLVEQRLVLLAILEARQNQSNINYDKPLIVTAESYMEHFNVNRNAAYDSLKKASKDLLERRFSYQENVKGKLINNTSRWVSEIGYAVNDAFVRIRFAQSVIPLVTELEKHFTSYEISQVSNLNSGYAVRLYELLISWRSTGVVPTIQLQDLRDKLGVIDGEYERMERFKTRVLDLSIKQINEHSDIDATYKQHKTGRAITAISFTFKPKKDAIKSIETGKFISLTDSQLSMYSSKLANLTELNNDAPVGVSTQEYALKIESDLKDIIKQQKYIKHLKKLGFKPSKYKS